MDSESPINSPCPSPVRLAYHCLTSTSAAFLLTSSPIASTSQLPPFPMTTFSPAAIPNRSLLETLPTTFLECQPQPALQEYNEQDTYQKGQMMHMQAISILILILCKVSLQHKRRREKNKRRESLWGMAFPACSLALNSCSVWLTSRSVPRPRLQMLQRERSPVNKGQQR